MKIFNKFRAGSRKQANALGGLHLNARQQRTLAIATAVAVAYGAYFLRSFFILIVVAGVFSYLFSPFYLYLQKHRFSAGTAAATTLLASIFTVLVPMVLVVTLATSQLAAIVDNLSQFFADLDVKDATTQIIDSINRLLSLIPFGDFAVTQENALAWLESGLNTIASSLVGFLSATLSNVFGLITTAIIYMYVFVAFLRHGDYLLNMFRSINPLGRELSNIYLARVAAMVRGAVRGQLIIAIVQGLFGSLTLALVGYPDYFFILFIMFTVLSVIPLGAGILIIPLGLIMVAAGNVIGGIVVIAEHLLINTNIDNILRPKLVPQEARLDSALMLVSVFAGIGAFGFSGIVIGPTIMILIVTTVQTFLETKNNPQS